MYSSYTRRLRVGRLDVNADFEDLCQSKKRLRILPLADRPFFAEYTPKDGPCVCVPGERPVISLSSAESQMRKV